MDPALKHHYPALIGIPWVFMGVNGRYWNLLVEKEAQGTIPDRHEVLLAIIFKKSRFAGSNGVS
jgi:hypothetical protein